MMLSLPSQYLSSSSSLPHEYTHFVVAAVVVAMVVMVSVSAGLAMFRIVQ